MPVQTWPHGWLSADVLSVAIVISAYDIDLSTLFVACLCWPILVADCRTPGNVLPSLLSSF
jgi:hypothetical protein